MRLSQFHERLMKHLLMIMCMLGAWLLSACGPTPLSNVPTPTPDAAAQTTTRAAPASTSVPSNTPTATPMRTLLAPIMLPNTEVTPAGTTMTVAPAPTAVTNTPGQPTRIVIPSLRVDSPVVPVGWTTVIEGNQLVSEWETADFAVGFHYTSALPGTVGNTVMSGHNNIKGAVFRDLDKLKVGDKLTVYTSETSYTYTVTQAMIVEEKFASKEQKLKNATWMAPTNDNRLTLISCWPRNNNTHRVIVVARPTP